MTATVRSEWIKLLSIRSPYWCIAAVAVLSLGIAALLAGVGAFTGAAGDPITDTDDAYIALSGLSGFGTIVLMIMAVLGITSEFRFGTIRSTFAAQPRRGLVLGAKAAVFGGLAVAVTVVLAVLSLLLASALISGGSIDLGSDSAVRQIWGIPVVAFCFVLVGLGVGAIIRHTAGALVVLLLWVFVLESIIAILPKVGSQVGPFLPFRNADRFLAGGGGDDFHWGIYGSIGYFAVIAVVVFAAGLLALSRRDA